MNGVILTNEFRGLKMDCKPEDDPLFCSSGDKVLERMGWADFNVATGILVMFLMHVFYRLVLVAILKFSEPPKTSFEEDRFARRVDASTLTALLPTKRVSDTFIRLKRKSFMVRNDSRGSKSDSSFSPTEVYSPTGHNRHNTDSRLLLLPDGTPVGRSSTNSSTPSERGMRPSNSLRDSDATNPYEFPIKLRLPAIGEKDDEPLEGGFVIRVDPSPTEQTRHARNSPPKGGSRRPSEAKRGSLLLDNQLFNEIVHVIVHGMQMVLVVVVMILLVLGHVPLALSEIRPT